MQARFCYFWLCVRTTMWLWCCLDSHRNEGDSSILPFFFFLNLAICPRFQTIEGHAPVSILDYLKLEFQLNTRFVENRVMPDQTLKKNKIKKYCMELEFHSKKFFVWSPHTRFKEPYSGVFKSYSDVLKPYSGIFLQNFFFQCDRPIPSSRSPIVTFLSPIMTFLSPIVAFS